MVNVADLCFGQLAKYRAARGGVWLYNTATNTWHRADKSQANFLELSGYTSGRVRNPDMIVEDHRKK